MRNFVLTDSTVSHGKSMALLDTKSTLFFGEKDRNRVSARKDAAKMACVDGKKDECVLPSTTWDFKEHSGLPLERKAQRFLLPYYRDQPIVHGDCREPLSVVGRRPHHNEGSILLVLRPEH